MSAATVEAHEQRYRMALDALAQYLRAECGLSLREARVEAAQVLQEARAANRPSETQEED